MKMAAVLLLGLRSLGLPYLVTLPIELNLYTIENRCEIQDIKLANSRVAERLSGIGIAPKGS